MWHWIIHTAFERCFKCDNKQSVARFDYKYFVESPDRSKHDIIVSSDVWPTNDGDPISVFCIQILWASYLHWLCVKSAYINILAFKPVCTRRQSSRPKLWTSNFTHILCSQNKKYRYRPHRFIDLITYMRETFSS